MASFFSDNDDLRFWFEKGIDWATLVELTEYGYRTADGFKSSDEGVAFYRDVLESIGQLAAEEVAPKAAVMDREGARLEDGEAHIGPTMARIFDRVRDQGLHQLCLPRELGGLNAPLMIYFLSGEMLARADVSTMAHFSFHGGMAMAMLAFSVHEGSTTFDPASARIEKTRFEDAIREIASGEAWGSMDITEPDAGSDMARLRMRAEELADGTWVVTGQKIFITSGHGKWHFVIARTEEATAPDDPFAGLAGLSMFLVKAYDDLPDGTRRRYVTIDRLEEKLGHHGSVTAAVGFDRTPAMLLGKRGEGFKLMLLLMNNARVGVGFEALGMAEAALRLAESYAAERTSMGKPIARHEMIADYLDEMRTDVQGIRALAVTACFHEEVAQKSRLVGRVASGGAAVERTRELRAHEARARRLTPLLKYVAAEKAVEISRRALQIHGGVGYTKEYGAEKLVRDAMVMPIYEGTSQIQSLMAMKDTMMGILKRPADFARRVGQARWRALSARDPLERGVARVQSLSLSAQQHLLTRTAADKLRGLSDVPARTWRDALVKEWDPKRDFALAMLHAERLTKLLVDEAILEILLEQAQRFPERRDVLERYLERAELRAKALHAEITTTGARLLASLAEPAAGSVAAE
ncbi:MAG TPA: acyl-CoA dehydrogenase family protein [Polyangiaceae bacterium]|nr:acyl-CoA dehydrogenase family protein [Polyangiaceae bacterium]